MTEGTKSSGGRLRWVVLLMVTCLILAGAGSYALSAFQRLQDSRAAPPAVDVAAESTELPKGSYVLFRNTAAGQGYGMAATVPAADPSGPRSIGGAACDRVYATGINVVCLSTNRGLVTSFEASIYGAGWQRLQAWALPGIPSRTRASGAGLVATTVFVTGHSYAGTGFSTETAIRGLDGAVKAGNLEEFALLVNGQQITGSERNIWGVTFVPGQPDAFFATAAASGRHWLVRGSIAGRTLTAVHDGVECPSISPDGTRVAFKKGMGSGITPYWKAAVLDLASGKETVLGESRSIDDQIEWLNDSFLLYGLPREGEAGDSDVWRIPADGGAGPRLYIEHAWSPSVVR
ncbi:hypothetical protein FBY31_1030 [Arthrobacter sp. SLBN-100]|uniref:hypothetical protein n=1 Tax=Arthrobacter sp. SLBN-100 TaxID=2768450 RepID=UPI001151D4AE|nr:hypothetical protein [Arthrobacter sp. SLBN-100]TQJ66981.1 hypothetical protein FBY31_1030 [Arthrobacter sp. SLBN-100]